MSGLSLIEIGTILLLCAIVLPIVQMSIEVQRGYADRQAGGSIVMKQALFIIIVLGIPGTIFEILGGVKLTQSGSSWAFIDLGLFFSSVPLLCPFSGEILPTNFLVMRQS